MLAMAVLLSSTLILQVDNVQVTKVAGRLETRADGTASTPGWTGVRLKLRSSKAGHLTYDLIGTPPDGIVAQVLTPVSATTTWKGKTNTIRDVTVKARTNKNTVKVKK